MKKIKQPQPPLQPQKQKVSFRAWLRANWVTLAVLLVCAGIFVGLYLYSHHDMLFSPQSSSENELLYETAVVEEVLADSVEADRYSLEEIYRGQQTLLVRVTSGRFEGRILSVVNHITPFYRTQVKAGDSFVIALTVHDGELLEGEYNVDFYEYNRFPAICILFAVFLAATVLIGGKKGAKSLIGLILTIICLIWILCPLLMKGARAVPTALLLCIFVEIFCFTLLDGVKRKTVCAMLSTAAGIGVAALFSIVAQSITRITSYSMYRAGSPEIEQFLFLQTFAPVRIHGLLTAGILISSLGAVMDVAMSLSSAINELKTVNPELGRKQLWVSAMRIGRDMVGTMTNTLILAFVGSGLTLILWMWAQNMPFRYFFSSAYFAVEVITGLASSIGVILAVPLTALIGAIFFGGEKTARKA